MKTCFVAMPIRTEGTDDHAHFWAIYQQVIKPVMTDKGYEVLRADEIQNSGNITKEIVLALSTADLVIADMTDLNPNVFYELGVRHAMRAKGTVMILDELRVEDIPFDVQAYRVIKFRGDITGIGKLAMSLKATVEKLESSDQTYRDNPVHDWNPSLPPNALDASKGSAEGELRTKIAELEQKIKRYEQIVGKEISAIDDRTPLYVIQGVLNEVSEGVLPTDILMQAEAAVRELRIRDYLTVIRRVIERDIRLSDRQFLTLAVLASNLGLDDVAGAIYDHALQIHPRGHDLRRAHFGYLAHSADPNVRARARQEVLKELHVNLDENNIITDFPALNSENAQLMGMMLDAYHADSLHQEALTITSAALEMSGHLSVVLRNHARALGAVGRVDECLEFHKKSIIVADADDTSMEWFGNELHNQSRHVDAAEVYVMCCLTDADDAGGFAHVAAEIAEMIKKLQSPIKVFKQGRRFPSTVGIQTIETALIAASSCKIIDHRDIDRMRTAANLVGLDLERITSQRMAVNERVAFASNLYSELESNLTHPEPEEVDTLSNDSRDI